MINQELNSWGKFTGSNFLKAEDVKDTSKGYIVQEVTLDNEEKRPRLILVHENNPNDDYLFDLNVTNSIFVKEEANIERPADLLKKKIFFNISKAYSPTQKKEVDTLRICKVE